MAKKNISRVIEAFVRGQKSGPRSDLITGDSKKTCSTDGTMIWSYSLPIAYKLDDKTALVLERGGHRNTTNSQIAALHYLLPSYGFALIEQVRIDEEAGKRLHRYRKMQATKRVKEQARAERRKHIYSLILAPHGRCVPGRCVEHERDSTIESCV